MSKKEFAILKVQLASGPFLTIISAVVAKKLLLSRLQWGLG